MELSEFLLSNGFSYVMVGEFTTDPLEKQFGKYRQGCGGAYMLTVRNVIEKHRIDRARFIGTLCDTAMLRRLHIGDSHSCNACSSTNFDFISILSLLASDIHSETKQVLVYVAGYVSASLKDCYEDSTDEYAAHNSYFDELNRGGLTVPPDCIVTFLYYMYVSYFHLCTSANQAPCFRVLSSAGRLLNDYYDLLDREDASHCCCVICNILMNNACMSKDSSAIGETCRKLAKFS